MSVHKKVMTEVSRGDSHEGAKVQGDARLHGP